MKPRPAFLLVLFILMVPGQSRRNSKRPTWFSAGMAAGRSRGAGSSCTSKATRTNAACNTAGCWRRKSPAICDCFALTLNHKAPFENWRTVRTFINALFLRKFELEYLEEMQGIAAAAGTAAPLRWPAHRRRGYPGLELLV